MLVVPISCNVIPPEITTFLTSLQFLLKCQTESEDSVKQTTAIPQASTTLNFRFLITTLHTSLFLQFLLTIFLFTGGLLVFVFPLFCFVYFPLAIL